MKCSNTENGCNWIGPLGTAKNHVTVSCDFTTIPCKYEVIGCSEKRTRKRMRDHEEDASTHLSLCLDAVKKLTQIVRTLPQDVNEISVPDYRTKKENNECFYSNPFIRRGYKVRLLVWPNGIDEARNRYVSVGIEFQDGPYGVLTQNFRGIVSIVLLHQLQDDDHWSHSLRYGGDDFKCPTTITERKFCRHATATLHSHSDEFEKDNTMVFKVDFKDDD